MTTFGQIGIAQVFWYDNQQFAKNSQVTAIRLLTTNRDSQGRLMASGAATVVHFGATATVEPA